DTLLYQLTIRNVGPAPASGVKLIDILGSTTPLVAGSVQTGAGTLTSGNSPGHSNVGVDVGTAAAGGGTGQLSHRVTINDPLPPGVTTVRNQAIVTGDNFTALLSDDPRTPSPNDPTVTGVTGEAAGIVTKIDALFFDSDGDGVPSPGDT